MCTRVSGTRARSVHALIGTKARFLHTPFWYHGSYCAPTFMYQGASRAHQFRHQGALCPVFPAELVSGWRGGTERPATLWAPACRIFTAHCTSELSLKGLLPKGDLAPHMCDHGAHALMAVPRCQRIRLQDLATSLARPHRRPCVCTAGRAIAPSLADLVYAARTAMVV